MLKLRQSAYSLIELLVTVSILGVLLGVMLPGMNEFLKNERLTTQINSLLSHLQYARSEAILRLQPVTVCASRDAASVSS